MANMSYCRMHNTYHDLVDVSENFGEVESKEEKMYAVMIVELCQSIARQFGEDSSREEIEEQLPNLEDEE